MIRIPMLLAGALLLSRIPADAARVHSGFRFFKAWVSETSTPEGNYAQYPKTISATGFFEDIAAKRVAPGIYGFDINSPLWSDGSGKLRYLALPDDSVITYVNDTDEYLFPEGAAFIKHFTMDTVKDRPASRIFAIAAI